MVPKYLKHAERCPRAQFGQVPLGKFHVCANAMRLQLIPTDEAVVVRW